MLCIARATAALDFCPGDCNLDGGVSVAEIQRAVLISLGEVRMNLCKAIDLNDTGRAEIGELVEGVNAALGECYPGIEQSFDCPWPDEADINIHAFVMAGQSNMRGVGVPEELPPHLQQGNPKVVNFGHSWVTLRPGLEWYGPEIGFAHTIAEACPNSRIGVLKIPRVATGINSWLREWDQELAEMVSRPNVGPLYPTMLERIDVAGARGSVVWEGFVWVHGNGDKQLVELAQQYGENLALLIGALRDDLDDAELPLIFHYNLRRLPEPPAHTAGVVFPVGPGDQIVEDEKWSAQFEIPHAFAANWARVPTRDLVHLNSEGYVIGGRLLAEAFLSGQ